MKELEYTIRDPAGIHARPAGLLVKEMQKFASKITLAKDGKTVDLKKLFALMGLAVKQNQTVLIRAEGEDEDAAIEKVKAFMEAEGM
ncbi:MAG: HPr family phosphocarrier protein [Clostridiales bacterium]|jgi:phosphocarrier protein|nr:HPr family phosphocarrier protein [Clostridiales bacterium]